MSAETTAPDVTTTSRGRINAIAGLWSRPAMRLGLGGLAFVMVAVVTYLIAELRLFTGFAPYDDEGYMLIALRSFVDHGSLYDQVFSQYGPFYYEAWGGLFSLLGIPVDHENGRVVTTFVWVTSSLGLGLATWRLTRSALLGLATQMLAFGALVTLVNEPMHPGGIICLLLAAIVSISCFVREGESPMAMAVLGGTVMALALVKINVGAFAFAALALACVVSYPVLAESRWLRPLVEVGFVATPLLLVLSKAGEGWARHYGVHAAAAALAVVIVLRARQAGDRPKGELWWLGGGLAAVGATVCMAILAAGTSPGGLLEGLIEQPLRQSDAFSIPLVLANATHFIDLLALALAVGYWYVVRHRRGAAGSAWVALVSAFSVLIGLVMAYSAFGRSVLFEPVALSGYQLALLGFAWVALIPPPGRRDGATAFGRLLLPLLAVLQGLHAFPVAGSQLSWSAFLLIPVGALCVANGVRGLASCLEAKAERQALAAVGALAAAIVMVVMVNMQLRQPLNEARAAHDGSTSLGLPGAEDVRISPEEVERYRAVAVAIGANCSSLITLPGMNSFYLWTGIAPPTGYNATAWPTLFDDEHERKVIDRLDRVDGLCLLRNTSQAEAWGAVEGPLVDYLSRGFMPVATVDQYELLKREGGGGSA